MREEKGIGGRGGRSQISGKCWPDAPRGVTNNVPSATHDATYGSPQIKLRGSSTLKCLISFDTCCMEKIRANEKPNHNPKTLLSIKKSGADSSATAQLPPLSCKLQAISCHLEVMSSLRIRLAVICFLES